MRGTATRMCAAVVMTVPMSISAAPAPSAPACKADAGPSVILHQDVPLYTVYAWERWGNFINAQAGSKTEIPYDAARLQVKVYTFPTGEIRAIRFANGVRTHRHINQTDTMLYSWQAHRVQFVDDKATVTEPGDFALHQKGVYHSGEEIRRGGGIDLEFAFTIPGIHNDPTGYWSLARDHPVEPAASWRVGGNDVEAIGDAAARAPANAVQYQVRRADFPGYASRELYLAKGTTLSSRDLRNDRLFFVLSGSVSVMTDKTPRTLQSEDALEARCGVNLAIQATEDTKIVQTSVPAVLVSPIARRDR